MEDDRDRGGRAHKATHTAAVVNRQTAELLEHRTSAARERGYCQMLAWAAALDEDRVWAIEDCRSLSGGLLLTAEEVAELLSIRRSTVDDYARRGLLPSLKLGRHRRFVRTDVTRALDALRRRGC